MNGSAKLVRKLYEVACSPHKGFGFQANELLRLGCELIGTEAGIITEAKGVEEIVKHVVSPLIPIDEHAVFPSCSFYGMHPHASEKIVVGDDWYGNLVFASRQKREKGLSSEQKDTVGLMAAWLSKEIERIRREEDLVEYSRKMQTLVKFDSLTGLYSRPSIEARLKRILQRSQHTAEPISAAVVDIDNFRKIEVRYGRAGADTAITAVAQAIDEAVRPTDPSARIGEDEFLVILIGANEDQAKVVAQRIVSKVADSHVEMINSKIDLNVSVAVTELSDEIMRIEEILQDTHARLMLSKKNGKNRVV